MNILFIAPIPPPIHGHSLISKALLDEMVKKHTVTVINTTKNYINNKFAILIRFVEIFKIIFNVWKNRKKIDAVYITISESLLGNLKDLLTYVCFIGNLSKITIHLHGGSIKKELWNRHKLIYLINRFFIKNMGGVIISGLSHHEIFNEIVEKNKLHVVRNYSPDHLFISEQKLTDKFEQSIPLKILYISGMREKKGYLDLLNSFIYLPEAIKDKIRIHFAGAFESSKEKEWFIKKIVPYNQIKYHDIVTEEEKKKLFFDAHVFCLPTKYYEGQPISILEAYASGCLVLTTNLGGIPDIFNDNVNGFYSFPGDTNSICENISRCLNYPNEVKKIALDNATIAQKKFKKNVYTSSIINIIETTSRK